VYKRGISGLYSIESEKYLACLDVGRLPSKRQGFFFKPARAWLAWADLSRELAEVDLVAY
jgi:hypothetical protein